MTGIEPALSAWEASNSAVGTTVTSPPTGPERPGVAGVVLGEWPANGPRRRRCQHFARYGSLPGVPHHVNVEDALLSRAIVTWPNSSPHSPTQRDIIT